MMNPSEKYDNLPDLLDHIQESHGMSEGSYMFFFGYEHVTLQQARNDHDYLHEVEADADDAAYQRAMEDANADG